MTHMGPPSHSGRVKEKFAGEDDQIGDCQRSCGQAGLSSSPAQSLQADSTPWGDSVVLVVTAITFG